MLIRGNTLLYQEECNIVEKIYKNKIDAFTLETLIDFYYNFVTIRIN